MPLHAAVEPEFEAALGLVAPGLGDEAHQIGALDPFSSRGGRLLPYAYRNAKKRHNGWILTSAGPDVDLIAPDGRGSSDMSNPLSTAVDGKSPARLGDINERGVIHFLEGTSGLTRDVTSKLDAWLEDLSYDPSNGTVSEGDFYRKSGVPQ